MNYSTVNISDSKKQHINIYPLDNTVIHTITQHISRGKKYGELVDKLHHVLDHHRYIVIMGYLKTSPKLKYHTDIFATDPIPHQTICHLEK